MPRRYIGPKARLHQDWYEENSESTQAALDAKNNAFTEWQNDPTSGSKKTHFKKL